MKNERLQKINCFFLNFYNFYFTFKLLLMHRKIKSLEKSCKEFKIAAIDNVPQKTLTNIFDKNASLNLYFFHFKII